jgi:hypothetical protein
MVVAAVTAAVAATTGVAAAAMADTTAKQQDQKAPDNRGFLFDTPHSLGARTPGHFYRLLTSSFAGVLDFHG